MNRPVNETDRRSGRREPNSIAWDRLCRRVMDDGSLGSAFLVTTDPDRFVRLALQGEPLKAVRIHPSQTRVVFFTSRSH